MFFFSLKVDDYFKIVLIILFLWYVLCFVKIYDIEEKFKVVLKFIILGFIKIS